MTGPAPLPRALFVSNTTYDLPLPPALAPKWDALAALLTLRVIGRAGTVWTPDARWRLIRVPRLSFPGAFQVALAQVVLREARRFRPQVIITQSPYEAVPVLAIRPLLRPRPKVLVEVHGDWRLATRAYGFRARRLYSVPADRAALLALRRADGVRSLSAYTDSLVREATGREPLGSFPSYLDLAAFREEPTKPLPRQPSVAWIGVLERAKNPLLLAEAWRLLARRCPEASVVIRGDGPERPLFEGLAHDYPGRVRLVPRLPSSMDVARLLDDCTVLALPSQSEGLPRVVMEAFARARPVVGTDVGGIPDLVRPEHNGLLVPPGDAHLLAEALRRILADRAFAERLGRAGHADLERSLQTPERYAAAVRRLVDRALAAPA